MSSEHVPPAPLDNINNNHSQNNTNTFVDYIINLISLRLWALNKYIELRWRR